MSIKTLGRTRRTAAISAAVLVPTLGFAQATPTGTSTASEEEDMIVLSPFEVTDDQSQGYTAATTLAGNRLNTELRDIGNAVQVVTSQFLKDIGATSNETLLQYTTNTEVGNVYGNYAGVGDGALLNETSRFPNPNTNTRVRGLAQADNTRNFFLTDIPWDSYNVDRVDLQRGPNSIMFGHGSPAGIINSGTKQAAYRTGGEVEFRFDGFGTGRATLDYNHELIENELAVRVAGLYENQKFKQDPAFQDSRRGYGALRWEPGFLRKGSARTILKANFERGDISSNRPRTLPPIDLITPWFNTGTYQGLDRNGNPRTYQELNKATFNSHNVQNDNTGRPNWGQTRPAINGGPKAGQPNPAYNPRVGNFGQSFGGPIVYFPGSSPTPANSWVWETREVRGIGPDGNIDGTLGYDFNRPVGIATQSQWAKAAGLDYAEIYKNNSLSDATVFDFYNNLIDGPNKEEWSDFTTFNVSLAQTFMNDKFGIELNYYNEDYSNGQLSFMTDSRQAIYIDMMKVFPDGTHDGVGTPPNNESFDDGTPNPNVGRAFITDSGQFGNNSFDSDRESMRATAFFTHDFEREGDGGTLSKVLGRHTFTGLLASDEQETDSRAWQRYAILDENYRQFLDTTAKFTDNLFAVNPVIYLGDSLINRTSASGAYLSRAMTKITIPSTVNVTAFDSTWANPPGVNPADVWINNAYLPPEVEYPDYDPNDPDAASKWPDRRLSTQSENPANYVGWTTFPVSVTDSEAAPGNRDLLTTSARLTRNKVTSKAFVWQAHFLDNSLVGTFGYRKDTAKSWKFSRDSNGSPGNGQVDLGPTYKLPEDPENVLDVSSTAYSVVAHLNDLPGLSNVVRDFPINVSLFYNNSSNFQPLANRVDAYGIPLDAPQGETTDYGILLQTKDGKYSLRINNYETTVTNANSNALGGAWFIGASQAWSGNWVNRFEFNWNSDVITDAVANPDPTNTKYNYGLDVGETLADAQAREAAAIAAWRTWQAKVDPRFYDAWGIRLEDPLKPSGATGLNSSTPQGFAVTEDSVSEGWEFEFSAQPTKNWRVTFNASQTDAVRKNIGGKNLAEFINGYEDALKNTAAGDLRIWWGGAGNETALFQWNQNIGFEWASRKAQEGSAVPELREWRFNAITNYDFTEGRLAGLNVGGGVRYEDSITIGYPPLGTPRNFTIDLNNPITGPSETNFDFWVGYSRKLTEKVRWRVQLNVRNVFQGDELIPINTQPDGSVAGYRIAPPRVWSITNTFTF